MKNKNQKVKSRNCSDRIRQEKKEPLEHYKMNIAFALDFIPRRMKELGYDAEYMTRWRHLRIDPNGVIKFAADNEYYYLISPNPSLTVKSKTGIYNLNDIGINEMQYEHKGKVKIVNQSANVQFAEFIQVIPFHPLK